MNRKEAAELLPIIKAFSEGKEIEGLYKGTKSPWFKIEDMNFNEGIIFRIKPEVKYRPFKNAEECWQEMLKHQPFGWIKCYEGYLNITYVGDEQVYLADPDGGAIMLDSKNSYQDNTFVDGAPFGVKIEDE